MNKGLRDLSAVVGGLLLAAALAFVAVAVSQKLGFAPSAAAKVRTSTTAFAKGALPEPEARIDEVVAPAERGVPVDVLKTATVSAAPWAPGLRLVKTTLGTEWEAARAELEDKTSGDVRAYAIGDLLPHGSLLVGITEKSADIMVADTHLVRLWVDGKLERLHDLTQPIAKPLKVARDLDPDYEDQIRVALVDLRSDDPSVVQAAIDALIDAGDPALELLVPQVDSLAPVRAAEYSFPAGGALQARPRTAGVMVMLILEKITGQTFGDLTKETLTDTEARQIASAWKRWWGQ